MGRPYSTRRPGREILAGPETKERAVAKYEYKTEVLTSMMGRDKLQVGDLEDVLRKFGDDGWELVTVNLDADIRGKRDGHLLIFKRPK
jgi:hypothetical protein